MATSIFKGISEENACFQTSFGDNTCVLLSVPNEKNSVGIIPWSIMNKEVDSWNSLKKDKFCLFT